MSEQEPEPHAGPRREPGRTPRDERRARQLIGIGAAMLFSGIALAVTNDDFGRWFIIAGVATLFLALHRFGRLGTEAPRAS